MAAKRGEGPELLRDLSTTQNERDVEEGLTITITLPTPSFHLPISKLSHRSSSAPAQTPVPAPDPFSTLDSSIELGVVGSENLLGSAGTASGSAVCLGRDGLVKVSVVGRGGGASDSDTGSMVVEERSGARILIGRVAIGV